MFTIHLAKEPFKFSCCHFTIFSPDHGERLHGHNYQVRVSIAVSEIDEKLGLAFDFNSVKPMIRELCDQLDERILLPADSEFLTFKRQPEQTEVRFGKRLYSFPKDETIELPIVNITGEELARFICERLVKAMKDLPSWTAVKVNVEETRGQSVSYSLKR